METAQVIYMASSPGPLRQGEIVSNLIQSHLTLGSISSEAKSLEFKAHPYAIVVTQDCDLTQDYECRQRNESDKLLPNILFCELTTAEALKDSTSGMNSKIWSQVKINKNERYHFLQEISPSQDALSKGLPELGADFKRYFTLPTDEVYERLKFEARRRCALVSPYLEHFSTRFAYYQFRVALPAEHFSNPMI